MDGEMIERVALAAWLAYQGLPASRPEPEYEGDETPEQWTLAVEQWKEYPGMCTHIEADGFRRCARAAIEAMREPTEEMVEDGADIYHDCAEGAKSKNIKRDYPEGTVFPNQWIQPVWQAMITAALSPKSS